MEREGIEFQGYPEKRLCHSDTTYNGAKYCSSVLELEAHLWKMVQGRSMGKNEMISLAMQMCPELKTKKLSSHEAEAVCMAILNS